MAGPDIKFGEAEEGDMVVAFILRRSEMEMNGHDPNLIKSIVQERAKQASETLLYEYRRLYKGRFKQE